MSEEIAARDAYARQIQADVVEVSDDGLVLDPTVFYARGGGQPGDQGLVRWPGGEVRVVDTVRKGGTTVHVYEGSPPAPGTLVVAEIDWERRYLLMRTHTALHALSAIIWRDFDAKVTGGNMEPGTARMDFELEGISVEFGQQVEDKLNEELRADHPVEILFCPVPRPWPIRTLSGPRSTCSLISSTRFASFTLSVSTSRRTGCTHVASTIEVGSVRVVKTESKGKANKRIRIELA